MVPLSQLTEETFQACLRYCMDFAPSLSHLLISYYNVFLGSDKVSWFVVDFTKFSKFFPKDTKLVFLFCFCLRGAGARFRPSRPGPTWREIFITNIFVNLTLISVQLYVCKFKRLPKFNGFIQNQVWRGLPGIKLQVSWKSFLEIETFREITQRINVAFTKFLPKKLVIFTLWMWKYRKKGRNLIRRK